MVASASTYEGYPSVLALVVRVIAERVRATLSENRHDELKRAEDDQAQQLKVALAALDTTKEDLLLNQLRRDTQLAREELLQVNLGWPVWPKCRQRLHNRRARREWGAPWPSGEQKKNAGEG